MPNLKAFGLLALALNAAEALRISNLVSTLTVPPVPISHLEDISTYTVPPIATSRPSSPLLARAYRDKQIPLRPDQCSTETGKCLRPQVSATLSAPLSFSYAPFPTATPTPTPSQRCRVLVTQQFDEIAGQQNISMTANVTLFTVHGYPMTLNDGALFSIDPVSPDESGMTITSCPESLQGDECPLLESAPEWQFDAWVSRADEWEQIASLGPEWVNWVWNFQYVAAGNESQQFWTSTTPMGYGDQPGCKSEGWWDRRVDIIHGRGVSLFRF